MLSRLITCLFLAVIPQLGFGDIVESSTDVETTTAEDNTERFNINAFIQSTTDLNNYEKITEMAKSDKTFEKLKYARLPNGFYTYGTTALQRSLYYQGFDPEFGTPITYTNKLGGLDFSPLNMIPSDADLKRKIIPRDPQKAFEYSMFDSTLFDSSNHVNLCYNGIGTEKDINKAKKLFKNTVFWNATAEEILDEKTRSVYFNLDSRKYYLPLYAYMLYHGIGVAKDKAKCDAILSLPIYQYCWKNFYTGWFVPKDFDFAIYCLKNSNAFWASGVLAKIYNGDFLPEHADAKKAEYWRNISDKRRKEFFLEICSKDKEFLDAFNKDAKGSLIKAIFLYGSQTRSFQNKSRYFEETFTNPLYDKEKSLLLIEKLISIAESPKDASERLQYLHRYSRYANVPQGRADSKFLNYIIELSAKYKAIAESQSEQSKD